MKRNKNFQLKLLEMGFEFKIVNRLLEITNEYSISQLVQMLSMENGFYLHNFYKNDKDNNDICYICQEPESRHLKLPKFKLPYEIVYFNKEAETIVFDEEDEDLIHEPSVLWENSLILHSNQSKNISEEKLESIKLNTINLVPKIKKDDKFENYNGSFSKEFLDSINVKKNLKKLYSSLIDNRNNENKLMENSVLIEMNKEECGICLGELENKYTIENCLHSFCKECLSDYLKENVKFSNSSIGICCPKESCKNIIKTPTLLNFLNEKEVEKLDKFQRRKDTLKIKNSIFCPFPDCESYSIKQNLKNIENLKCIDSNHMFCSGCLMEAHPEKLCNENIQIDQWIKINNDVKRCPKCGLNIQKIDGCNHIKCVHRGCNYEFCWICLEEYTNDHFTNPGSTCYFLDNIDQNSIFASSIMRLMKCIITPFLIILAIIIIFIFSPFFIVLYIFQEINNRMVDRNDLKQKLIFCIYFFNIIFFGTIFYFTIMMLLIFIVISFIVWLPVMIGGYFLELLKNPRNSISSTNIESLNNPVIQEQRNQQNEFRLIERRRNLRSILEDKLNIVPEHQNKILDEN